MKIRLGLLRGLVFFVGVALSLSFSGCEEDGMPSVDENMLDLLMSGNTPVSYGGINHQIYEKQDGKWVLSDKQFVGISVPFTIFNGQRLYSTMGPVYFAYGDVY